MDEDNKLARFNDLVREMIDRSQVMDDFDLDSGNVASMKQWAHLAQHYFEAASDVLTFANQYNYNIRSELHKMLTEATK
jgi:hypothetical protein